MKFRIKTTKKENRVHLVRLNCVCELTKLIKLFFPELIPLLGKIPGIRIMSLISA